MTVPIEVKILAGLDLRKRSDKSVEHSKMCHAEDRRHGRHGPPSAVKRRDPRRWRPGRDDHPREDRDTGAVSKGPPRVVEEIRTLAGARTWLQRAVG